MRSNRLAVPTLLAAALALAVGSIARADDEARKPEEKSFEEEIKVTVKLKYLLYLPKGYESSGQSYPLILFLHGAGESGDDLARVRRIGLPPVVEKKGDFPFIVVAPQSARGGWNPDALNALLDDVTANYRVDKDRVYLTGLSMGGFGTWALAAEHSDRFAAIAPICGGGDPKRADRLKGLPIWAFHGAKDNTVPLARSEDMIKAIKEAGGDPKLTVYPEAGHDSWTQAYGDDELYEWFLRHRRGGPKS